MVKRGYKLIICVVLVSALFIGFGSAFAFAESAFVTRAKAGVAAVLLASQLFLHPIDVALSEPYASGIDPEGRIEWVETFPEYLERSKIRVYPDVVTIDGVPYTDIWLGPEAAQSLRLKGLDFVSAYNIANNQSSAISYATGVGYLDDTPIYSVDGMNRTQATSSMETYELGGIVFSVVPQDLNNSYDRAESSDGLYQYMNNRFLNSSFPVSHYVRVVNSSSFRIYYQTADYPNWYSTGSFPISQVGSFIEDPFSFDYTSGVIDAPLNPDDGLLLRIPSSHSGTTAQDSYDIHDIVNDYPDVATPQGHTVEINPELNPDFETDINLGNGVGDLIRTILILLDVLDNIDIEFAPEPSEPEPPGPGVIDPLPDPDPAPDEPVAGTSIADTDWSKLDEILRWIQSTIDSIRHITESLQTMLDTLFNQIQQIIESLQSLPEQLLEDIEIGPSKVFRKALDVLKSLFMPLLLPIKAMMGLWHYVVEWIQSITSPFTWILGVMSGTSYNMVLPIYAVLAGSICIAIYKSLGR